MQRGRNPAAQGGTRGGVFLWAPRWGVEHLEQGARFQIVGADIEVTP